MKPKIVLLLLALILTCMPCALAASVTPDAWVTPPGPLDNPMEIDMTAFSREDGHWQYAPVAWGASPEEVAEAFGLDYADATLIESDRGIYKYLFRHGGQLDGYIADLWIAFSEEGLYNLVWYFWQPYTPDMPVLTLYEDLCEIFAAQYGPPDMTLEEGSPQGLGQNWLNRQPEEATALLLHYMEKDGTERTTLDIGRVIERE